MTGGQIVWGNIDDNIMTHTAFTNCYRGLDGETTAYNRPIMSVTASGLNIQLQPGIYFLVWGLTGSGSSGPWGQPYCEPGIGSTGSGIQQVNNGTWVNLEDSGTGQSYGMAMKLTGVTRR